MSANFIPPIPIGQFKPSSEAIASWLYEVWKYLQENPIPTSSDVSQEATAVAQNYVTVNVPPMIASAIAALNYSDLVNDTTLPVYRASNDEIDNTDLLEAWAEGCRFALVDDEAFFIMIKNGETITLLQVLTEEQAAGVISVNGQSGVVVIADATTTDSGLMSSADKTTLNGLKTNAIIPYGTCGTAAATVEKAVTVTPEITSLIEGQLIAVKYSYSNTATGATLNVNGLGAKPIKLIGNGDAGTTPAYSWTVGQTLIYRYDATLQRWVQITQPRQGGATPTESGLMAAADKGKLNALPAHIECGQVTLASIAPATMGTVDVTFSTPFASTPRIIVSHGASGGGFAQCMPRTSAETKNGFRVAVWNSSTANAATDIIVTWVAIATA